MSSSLLLVVGITLLCATANAVPQYKTAGIKTHYSQAQLAQNATGSLRLANVTNSTHNNNNSVYYAEDRSYNNLFVPAETYQGGSHGHYISPTTQRPVLDATAEFLNKTRATIADGVCYKEVPTASLARDPHAVPAGNGTTPDKSRIQVCCDGYERNAHVYRRCDPICADNCPNGICVAPNKCVCIPGHVRNQEGKCISTCPLGCGNGTCDEHNQCRCKDGYKLEPLEQKYCLPECIPGCAHGQCVAPNKCACLEGYRLTGAGSCEPKCDNCENGQCTAPGFCSCNAGYQKISGKCEPICSLGCLNGRCAAPDTCECPSGFQIDRTGSKCVPHCDLPCLNGVCSGHNTCTCNPGYIQDEQQSNVCKAHCPQGCPNGYCSSPNFCICKPGFIKNGIKGRQTCVSSS